MYMPEKLPQTTSPPPQPPLEPPVMNYYSKEEEEEDDDDDEEELNHRGHDMMMEVSTTHLSPHNHHHHHHHNLGGDTSTSGGEETNNNNINPCASDLKAPKKRAETWVQEETRSLITMRREIDSLFNTSKSNKHLWDQISLRMREKGFDRSPTMCTDKWRNLLKEFKKAKQNQDPNGCSKMSYYNEIEEIIRERSKNGATYKSPSGSKVDPFMQFSDKGLDETSITFGPVEANGRATLNLESSLDHDGHPLAIAGTDAVAAGGVSPWNWRETHGNGEQSSSFGGRVISIKWEGYTKRIGIDGTPDAIKETIKTAFRLRTRRLFWLEDEDNIARTIDRDMPLGNYTLHLDEGLTIKVCLFEDPDHLTEDKTFYTEEEFHEFLSRRGWTCLREYNGYRNIDSIHELFPGGIYRGVN